MNQIPNTTSITPSFDTAAIRIAWIQAGWHEDIVNHARLSFLDTLRPTGVADHLMDVFRVPGSFEIPLLASNLAGSGRFDVIVAAGLVVDGGIYRHDFVAQAVIQGLMQVQLESRVPVLSVVLTPHKFHEHETHGSFFSDHFKIKGREAAEACISTLNLYCSPESPLPLEAA